jgi:hypothetical protein
MEFNLSPSIVRPLAPEGSDEPEVTLKFVPFPAALPGDPELV